MFQQFEKILKPGFLGLSTLFLVLIILRIRGLILRRNPRVPFWKGPGNVLVRAAAPIRTLSLFAAGFGLLYFVFIIAIQTAVLRETVKTLFILSFGLWVLIEAVMSLFISEKLSGQSVFRRSLYFLTVLLCLAVAVVLFPKILQSCPFPPESECVIIDFPVRGEWLAGHAGATTLTNAHFKNRYAIDCLKIGPDGRFYRGNEKEVTDFYSYEEPVYAPADGRVTERVDGNPSDRMGKRDTDNPGGNYVILDIGKGKYFYVGHLMKDRILVREGQVVTSGALLGYIGNSGNTFFPHLHIHIQNKPTADPEGRITYPFRFRKIRRKRWLFWREVNNAALIRNDRVRSLDPDFPTLTGPYLGQDPPGRIPEVFLTGLLNTVTTGAFCNVFTPEMDQMYFTYYQRAENAVSGIAWIRRVDGVWTRPEILGFSSGDFDDNDMCLLPDGNTMIFRSRRPLPAGRRPENTFLWYVTRGEGGWSAARPLLCGGEPVRTGYPSASGSNTLYFSHRQKGRLGVYRSKRVNGEYQTPEYVITLFSQDYIHGDLFVAPDESYLIVSGRDPEGKIGSKILDLNILFKRSDGSWGCPVNMGPDINTRAAGENCPAVSPDGRYFFFHRYDRQKKRGNMYWVDAGIIKTLKAMNTV